MDSVILQRTISSVVDQRIVLSNSHFARPHGFTTWSKLRIAVRWSMRDGGATLTGTPEFAVGLCSGSTSILGDATCTHFVGVRTTGSSWTRSAGPPVNYQVFPTGSGKMVGTTWTTATNWLSVAGYAMATATTGDRFCWFLDITKGSPNYTINGYARNVGSSGDIDVATYLAQAEIDSASLTNHAIGNSGTVAVDEATNGTLDHAQLRWNRTTPEIEISDWSVVRLS